MKLFFKINFVLFLAINTIVLNAQTFNVIDSLSLLPSNPDTSDNVKIICYSNFPQTYCTLDSSHITVSNLQVTVYAYHVSGLMTTPCSSIDTITIGKLSAGNYNLIYDVETCFMNCTTYGRDSLNFDVNTTNSIYEQNKFKLPVKIYPNPSNEQMRIEIAKGMVVNSMKLYDQTGKLVKTFSPTDSLLNISELGKGQYLLSIEINGTTYTEKIILP